MIDSTQFGRNLSAIFLAAFSFSSSLQANVSLKNGNFFMGYTDIVYPGGFEPKVERVYNSKTPYKGMFGWGWGNEYEVYLSVSADGSVIAHEYGGGAENRFNSVSFKPAELTLAIDKLAKVAQKSGVAGSGEQLKKYRAHLQSDATFRNDEWEKFRSQGVIEPRELSSGTQLRSNRFNYQYITKTPVGYVRTFDTGKSEKFDSNGRLIRIADKNGNSIDFTYGKDGHIQKLVDNFNRKMFYSFNSQGFVAKIEGEGGKKAEYKYNNLGELTFSKDVDGNAYSYKYDSQSRHNLVEIQYSDKSTMTMAYFGMDKHENIKSVKDRDGTLVQYSFDEDPSDPGHLTVGSTAKGSDGKEISKTSYEYFNKFKPDGEEWTQRMVAEIDGDKTDTTYNELCNLPLVIKHGSDTTSFAYDIKCRVLKKETPSEVTELQYDGKAGKVSLVTKTLKESKSKRSKATWSKFSYDDKANLVLAEDSTAKKVKLFYDLNGRIKSLVDQDRHQIAFKYNENSKPIEITDPSVGSINVSYTNSGEIKKVDSTAGRKIALQVTSSFQNLLDIIRPAGVNLSF